MPVNPTYVGKDVVLVALENNYELEFCANNFSEDGRAFVRAEKFYCGSVRDKPVRSFVDTYHIVGDITRHAPNAFTCRYHTADWEYFPEKGGEMYVGRLENIPIRGLEGASSSISEALYKIARHYDERKDNLMAMPIRRIA